MAYSYVRYTGNGSTTNYTFPFPYIAQDHIKVRVNSVLVTTWSFLNASTIQFASAPAAAAVIEIRRETPKETAIVNFTDGSVLLERDLDLLATFDLYLAQETKDGLDSSITQTSLGVWDAQSKRVTNVADPVNAQDAVTKNWVETTYTPTISGFATAAASSATASAGSATASANSATAAAASYDSFDDRYLGAKAVAPTTDNDGQALITGTIYWDTPSSQMFTWNGTSWRPTFLIGNTVRSVVTATAGQTVVTTPTYLIGSNTLQVFVNGVKVLLGADYTETTQNSITFVSGLTLGGEVELIAQQAFAVDELRADLVSAAVNKGSSLVSHLPAGTGAVPTTVQTKLRESVSVKDFGAVVDGVTDDSAALALARAQVGTSGGVITTGGKVAGAGTDLRGRALEFSLGNGSTYATGLSAQFPLVHSYIFNGTPTAGPGYANYGMRLDYQTKPGVDVQSSVGFASVISSYSTNTLGALLGNNTNQVAGVFNASAMDAASSAGVYAINALVYSGYTGTQPQSVVGMEVDLTVTNPAGFFNEASKSFAVGYASNLTGSQDGSIGFASGQSSGGTNGWLHGALLAGCKNTGLTVARQYVTPDTGVWVSAATTYGIYVGAKPLYPVSSVQTPAYSSLYNPAIGIALGQRGTATSSSNKLRLVSTDGASAEHYIDQYSDSGNNLQFEFDGVKKLTIAPTGALYIQNTQLLTTRQTVTGSRSSGAALVSLLAALAAHGLITDNTTA